MNPSSIFYQANQFIMPQTQLYDFFDYLAGQKLNIQEEKPLSQQIKITFRHIDTIPKKLYQNRKFDDKNQQFKPIFLREIKNQMKQDYYPDLDDQKSDQKQQITQQLQQSQDNNYVKCINNTNLSPKIINQSVNKNKQKDAAQLLRTQQSDCKLLKQITVQSLKVPKSKLNNNYRSTNSLNREEGYQRKLQNNKIQKILFIKNKNETRTGIMSMRSAISKNNQLLINSTKKESYLNKDKQLRDINCITQRVNSRQKNQQGNSKIII